MSRVACEGWWEQAGYGRQPMTELSLSFENGEIRGRGVDLISPFEFTGQMTGQQVRLIKQYTGAFTHQVLYAGTFDGEGTMRGTWQIDSWTGEWLIRLASVIDGGEIQQIG